MTSRGCQCPGGERLPWMEHVAQAFAMGSALGLQQVPELSLQLPHHTFTLLVRNCSRMGQ